MRHSRTRVVVALAAPRSGLSVLVQCLGLLGLGNPADDEDASVSSPALINRLLLQDLQRDPMMVGGLPEDWRQTTAAAKARARIEGLMAKALESGGPALIADTALWRVLPLWLDVLRVQKIEPRFICLVRQPWEMAQSLVQTEDVDLRQAHLLWIASYREALASFFDYGRSIVTFDQLLANPVATFGRVGEELAVDYPYGIDNAYRALLDFVQPALKKHHLGHATEQDKSRFAVFNRIYDALRAMQGEAGADHYGNRLTHVPSDAVWAELDLPISAREQELGGNLIDWLFEALGAQERQAKQSQLLASSRARYAAREGGLVAEFRFPGGGGPGHAEKIVLPADQWHRITLPVPRPKLLRDQPLRFIPLNGQGTVLISAVKLIDRASGETLWVARTPQDFDALTLEGSVMRIPDLDNVVLVVTGTDPLVGLPAMEELPDCPIMLEVWLKASRSQDVLKRLNQRRKPRPKVSSNLVWLASYPRSGNTLVRSILNHNFGLKSYSIYNDQDDIGRIPEIADAVGHECMNWSFLGKKISQLRPEDFDLFEPLRRSRSLKIVKTHSPYHDGFGPDKVIYIYRDGRASLRSFASFKKTFGNRDDTDCELLDELLCNGDSNFGIWDHHILSWMKHSEKRILFLKYEDVISNHNEVFKKLARFLNIEPLRTDVLSFQELQAVNSDFFRGGQQQSWQDLFDDTRHALFWILYHEAMSALGYQQNKSPICEILAVGSTEERDSICSLKVGIPRKRLIEFDRTLQGCAEILATQVSSIPAANRMLLAERLRDAYSKSLKFFSEFADQAEVFAWTDRWEALLNQMHPTDSAKDDVTTDIFAARRRDDRR